MAAPSIPTPAQSLTIVSRAWGKQEGYAFFPWISGDAPDKETRIKSFHEGPAFQWPQDRPKILKHMENHQGDDLYWCPSLFEKEQRKLEFAMDEHALWADLDEVDPRKIKDYPPTVAWETSPGRFQGLWLITGGDMMGSSWAGGENQRLTYYLGADAGGWDTTQLLRLPGWKNHKYSYREDNSGKPVQGRLLWNAGRRYLPDEFEDLPAVQTVGEISSVLENEVDHVDRHEVWGKIRLKLPKRARDLFGAREVTGDRSEQLWWMIRCLADVGCTVTEIVALVRPTPWNKFAGRHDELRRLTIEASKAVAAREEKVPAAGDQLEDTEEEERPDVVNLFDLVANVRPPEWIVKDILAIGACGFIAGQPKSYKSWIALDLILSVATGIPFLDHFPVRAVGPTLYIQEEDSLPLIKGRLDKIWPGKQADRVRMVDGQLVWDPPDPRDTPQVGAVVRGGITVSDPAWQSWLDEKLELGFNGIPFRLLVIDPLMMVAGEIDENRSQEMTTRIFRPLKQLADKHKTAIIVVHHMKKTDGGKPTRGGQMMLGSVANHAWAEDSMYIRRLRGDVVIERESKHTMGGSFKVQNLRNKGWAPRVVEDRLESPDDDADSEAPQGRSPRARTSNAERKMRELGAGPHTTKVIAESMNITPGGARRQLMRLAGEGKISRVGDAWQLTE